MELNRLQAAAHINRWRGWTVRPISILEHMVIGVDIMHLIGMGETEQKLFLIHDMHETEVIGDVPTPDKNRYCNSAFHEACARFDIDLMSRYGIFGADAHDHAMSHLMDHHMSIVEHEMLALVNIDGIEPMNRDKHPIQSLIWSALMDDECTRTSQRLIERWLDHAERLGMVRP